MGANNVRVLGGYRGESLGEDRPFQRPYPQRGEKISDSLQKIQLPGLKEGLALGAWNLVPLGGLL